MGAAATGRAALPLLCSGRASVRILCGVGRGTPLRYASTSGGNPQSASLTGRSKGCMKVSGSRCAYSMCCEGGRGSIKGHKIIVVFSDAGLPPTTACSGLASLLQADYLRTELSHLAAGGEADGDERGAETADCCWGAAAAGRSAAAAIIGAFSPAGGFIADAEFDMSPNALRGFITLPGAAVGGARADLASTEESDSQARKARKRER